MAVSSYNAIGSVTLSSAQTQVTFSDIPQIYTDLVVVCSLVATTATLQNAPQLRINGDQGSNYSATALNGNGTNAASGRWSNQTVIYADYYGILQNDGIGTMTAHYMNYTNNTTYKTVSIQFITDSPNTFAAGTTFNLYGIGANQLKASGGDIIVSDGSYWYHAFKTSGTFTPLSALTCDYLVVAGGGGGGTPLAGGGGAGGLRSTVTATGGGGSLESALSLSANVGYTVTVGAGGAVNINGSNSTFSTITSTGGGRGGYYQTVAGATGGSGGGGAGGDGTVAGGSGTTNQGYAGGSGNDGAAGGYVTRVGGGGGGAGAVGANGNGATSAAGNGGNGVQIISLATPTGTGNNSGYYAGGGGGSVQAAGTAGQGGLGGGGRGGANVYGARGVANTGSGGGGTGQQNGSPGIGGSGIVIVRYAV